MSGFGCVVGRREDSRRRFWLVAGLLVALPFLLWATQWGRDQLTLRRLARLEPPISVLAEPAEDPGRPAGSWLLLALNDRPFFDRAAAFCRGHRDLPLPNCTNLLVADRLVALLPQPVATHRPEAADAD